MSEETLGLIIKELDIKTEMGKRALGIVLANIQLLDKKQQDYGSRNISDFGLYGVIVRLNDKIQRLKTLNLRQQFYPDTSPNYESLTDTLIDISNYGIIGSLLIRNEWT